MPGCSRCGGSGVLVEYRLIWKIPRPGQRPQGGCLRVDDAAEGWRRAGLLEAGAVDVDVLSGVKDCSCRKPEEPEAELAVDYKMRQAGDR
jgi:hypothetical protein